MTRQIPLRIRDAIFRITRITEILFSFLSCSITIISYGTAFWYVDVSKGLHAGLWQKCVGNPSECVGIDLEYSGLDGELFVINLQNSKQINKFDNRTAANRIRYICCSLNVGVSSILKLNSSLVLPPASSHLPSHVCRLVSLPPPC